jgi:uncharacterized protein with HEPN domain
MKVDSQFTESHQEIPWLLMYAMRNRLSHGYDRIDMDLVWATIHNDLPDIYGRIKDLSLT